MHNDAPRSDPVSGREPSKATGVRKGKRRTGGVRSEAAKRRSEEDYRAQISKGVMFHQDIVWQPKNRSWLVSRSFGTGWRWRGTAHFYEDALLLHSGCINLRGPEDVIGSDPDAPRKRKMHARDMVRRLRREGHTAGGSQETRWDNIPKVCASMLERCENYVDEEEEGNDDDDDGGDGDGVVEGEEEDDDGVEEGEDDDDDDAVEVEGVVVHEGEGEGEGTAVIVEAETWDEEWDTRSTATAAAASDLVWPTCSGRVSKQAVRYDGRDEAQQRSYNIKNRKKHVHGSFQAAGVYFVHMKLRGVHASVHKARAKFAPLKAFHTDSLLDATWGRPV